MIQIFHPQNFIPERTYIIDALFNQFLGIKYEVSGLSDNNHYQIKLNDSVITIEDHFFNQQDEENGYLFPVNIPQQINTYTNKDLAVEKLPVIYGIPDIQQTSEKITCCIDLFASSFFMLTRWEEVAIDKKDKYSRFPADSSLAFKNNFLERPIVNEYAQLLLMLIHQIAPDLGTKQRKFQCIPTHDVDHLRKWSSLKQIRKKLAHDFITQKRPLTGIKNILDAVKSISGVKKDPYNTFEYIVDLSLKNNLTSHFYFMSGGISRYDNNYNPEEAKSIIQYLQKHKQIIGLHPSYSSLDNPEQWAKEKATLELIAGQPIEEGRQHYLRFEVPETWQIWESNGMKTDSTLGYSEYPGFRCGSCYPFTVFDVTKRTALKLIENPLILMETTLISYMQLTPEEAYEVAKKLYFTVRKYNGNFTFLWHNSAMHTVEDLPYLYIYESIVNGFPEDEK